MDDLTVNEYKSIQRQLMWDLMRHDAVFDPEVQAQVGCVPASMDVLEAEHEAADIRAERVTPYMMRVMYLAALTATIVGRTDLVTDVAEGSETDRLASLTTLIASGAVAVLSDLLDAGVLTATSEEA